jgi:endonuclease-3
MAALTKTQKISSLVKQVNKYIKNNAVPLPPKDRCVLDVLMYAALLENTTFENADLALTTLQNYYIDWNEVRVCTIRELAAIIPMIPQSEDASRRIKQALQALFEKTYSFDLEDLRKRGRSVADSIKQLTNLGAGTPFMIDYTALVAFGSHQIPLDEAALQLLRPLGLTQLNPGETREVGAGLERGIPKTSGLLFSVKFHHLAALFYAAPEMPERKAFLKAVDPASLERSSEPPQLKQDESAVTPASPFKPADAAFVQSLNKRSRKPSAEKTPAEKPVKKAAVKKAAEKPVKNAPVKKAAAKPVKKTAVTPSKVSPPKTAAKKPVEKIVKAAKRKSPSTDIRKKKPK